MTEGECRNGEGREARSQSPDASERKVGAALRAENNWVYTTLNSIRDAVLITDIHCQVNYLNHMAEELSGWSSEEAIGKPFEQVLPLVDNQTYQRAIDPAACAMAENRSVELALNAILTRRDGRLLEIEDSAAPIHNQHGEVVGAVVVFRDACHSLARSARNAYQAQHDPLTSLPNRFLFADRLSCAMGLAKRHRQQMALLYLDIDHFKAINDALGHAWGDRYLQIVAERLSASIRTTDTVCRQGGDEFVVLLSEIESTQSALGVANKLLLALAKPCLLGEHEMIISASIGVCMYPEHADNEDDLLHYADMAMYEAKQNGRNQWQLFRPDMIKTGNIFNIS